MQGPRPQNIPLEAKPPLEIQFKLQHNALHSNTFQKVSVTHFTQKRFTNSRIHSILWKKKNNSSLKPFLFPSKWLWGLVNHCHRRHGVFCRVRDTRGILLAAKNLGFSEWRLHRKVRAWTKAPSWKLMLNMECWITIYQPGKSYLNRPFHWEVHRGICGRNQLFSAGLPNPAKYYHPSEWSHWSILALEIWTHHPVPRLTW